MSFWFLRGHQPRRRDRRCRLVLSFLALALLSTPVSYRGGSDVAHAHSFLHFLSDAATGSLDHHRRWAADETARHGEHDRAESATFVVPAPAGVPGIEALGPASERASAIGLAMLLLAAMIAGGLPLILSRSGMVIGRGLRPPVPPPRISGLGA
jgi:hypothetical protein